MITLCHCWTGSRRTGCFTRRSACVHVEEGVLCGREHYTRRPCSVKIGPKAIWTAPSRLCYTHIPKCRDCSEARPFVSLGFPSILSILSTIFLGFNVRKGKGRCVHQKRKKARYTLGQKSRAAHRGPSHRAFLASRLFDDLSTHLLSVHGLFTYVKEQSECSLTGSLCVSCSPVRAGQAPRPVLGSPTTRPVCIPPSGDQTRAGA
jgi:hypothetical protein